MTGREREHLVRTEGPFSSTENVVTILGGQPKKEFFSDKGFVPSLGAEVRAEDGARLP